MNENSFIKLDRTEDSLYLILSGDWTLDNAHSLDTVMRSIPAHSENAAPDAMYVDCGGINALDTAGALLVHRFSTHIGGACALKLDNVRPEHKSLFDVVHCTPPSVPTAPHTEPWYLMPVIESGMAVFTALRSMARLLSFLGLVLARLGGSVFDPGRVRLIPVIHQMEVTGLRAMGIVGLISFLIGAVMVNQGAIQLAKFGADIFVIDMLGISHLRELGILLTAIIIAGRSGSAFTAQIGSMVLREEVDAMKTMGMNVIDVLVLPRMLALLICLPLLAFYSDVMGIAGGVVMAWAQLDITPGNFLVYFQDEISIDHFWVGILKAPFFAAVIATCGCYQGLRVEGSADALGARTTKSVVQSIFLVIVFDALFAIFFTSIDL